CAVPVSFPRAVAMSALLAMSVLSCSHDATAPKVVANGFVSISAGGGHTCALTAAGVAYCWGSNDNGQLGDNTSATHQVTPTLVAGGRTYTSIVAGLDHTCALTAAGAAYCWGGNFSGQLGDGTTTQRPVPTLVTGGPTFASIATGARSNHNCGISTGGFSFCWGSNGSGQLGTAANSQSDVPSPVQGGVQFASMTTGAYHTCALTKQGSAYCWGADDGELGIGTPDTTVVRAPTAVQGGLVFGSLSAAIDFNCGIATGGAAYCWGDNANGELGDGTGIPRTVPVQVQGGPVFTAIASGGGPHACGLTSAGAAYCWGEGFDGELGNGSNAQSSAPVAVSGGLVFRTVVAGALHSCGLTATGVAYCWGNNGEGELGNGTINSANIPVEVVAP
ncbi:MAG: RCC1 domain-containing protein, partial [Gemmatimonadales bacterium]